MSASQPTSTSSSTTTLPAQSLRLSTVDGSAMTAEDSNTEAQVQAFLNSHRIAKSASSWQAVNHHVAPTILKCVLTLRPLTPDKILLGWQRCVQEHALIQSRLDGAHLLDRSVVEDWALVCQACNASYLATTVPQVCTQLGIKEADVVHLQPVSHAASPAHTVVVHHVTRSVLLIIRGTATLSDILTDLCALHTGCPGGQAHSGMLRAAKAVLADALPPIASALVAFPGYRLRFIGHSLGAGVAALAALLLREGWMYQGALPAGVQPTATCLACPPVVCQQLASACSEFVTSIVFQDDIVPRFCLGTLHMLSEELNTASRCALVESQVVKVARSAAVQAVNIFSAVQESQQVQQLVSSKAGATVQKVVGHVACIPGRLVNSMQQQLEDRALLPRVLRRQSSSGKAYKVDVVSESLASTTTCGGQASAAMYDARDQQGEGMSVIATSSAAEEGDIMGVSDAKDFLDVAAAVATADSSRQEVPEEEGAPVPASPHVQLHCPGKLFHIHASEGPNGQTVEVVHGSASPAFSRLLLKQSMVADHRVAAYSGSIAAWLDSQASGNVYAMTQQLTSTQI